MAYDWGEIFKHRVKSYRKTSIIVHIVTMCLLALTLSIFLTPLPYIDKYFWYLKPLSISCLIVAIVIAFFGYPLKKSRIEEKLHEEILPYSYENLYEIVTKGNPELKKEIKRIMGAYGKIEKYQYDELIKNFKYSSPDTEEHLTIEKIKERLAQ